MASNDNSQNTNANQDNPLLHRLSPQQFDTTVHFYEADQNLTSEDRQEIANDLQSMVIKTSFVSYGSAVLGFGIPTLYNRYAMKPQALKSKPFFYRPFMSFLIGLTTMMIVNQQTMKYFFKKKINSFESWGDTRQLDIWKTMDYHQASLFFLYYRRTAENTSFILSDPRKLTEKSLHEVHYIPQNHKSDLGFQNSKYNVPESSSSSSWAKIREANGFADNEHQCDEQHVNNN